jgi:hypothetical protein
MSESDLNAALRKEMRNSLEEMPGVSALCLSFSPWRRLVAEARLTLDDDHLASQLGRILWHARQDGAHETEELVFPGKGEVGVVLRIGEDKLLIALGNPKRLDDASLRAIQRLGARMEKRLSRWESRLLLGTAVEAPEPI